jgi:hypothetical protein
MVLSRTAPAVAVELGPEPAWRACCTVLWALTAAMVAVWLSQRWGLAPGPVLCAVCLGLALVSGGIGWRMSGAPAARLEWTGRDWRLRQRMQASARAGLIEEGGVAADPVDAELGPRLACAPEVMIDLGTWMLLRLGVPGRSRWSVRFSGWVAVSQRRVGRSWHGLRVALYGAPQARPHA